MLNNITLSEWNEDITNNLMPNIVILAVHIALGTIGNVLVILVYAFQMRGASEERYFIPILAFFDMIAVIYVGGYYIFQSCNQTIFSNNILCKTLVFFAGNTTYNSVFILFIIAIQRYMKVCRPRKQPMSISVKRTALLLALLMSLICALPLPFVFGTVPFHNIDFGIYGMRCGRLKDGHPLVRTVYSVVAGLFVFVIVTSLIVIYGRIIGTVFRRLQVNKKDLRSNEKRSETTDRGENNPVVDGFKGIEMVNITDKTIKHSTALQTRTNLTGHNIESAATKQRRTTNRRLTYKLTVMFFIITTVFLLSYIPKVVLLFLEGINEDFWETLSASQRPGVTFLYHIFILHNIVNPIVYAFFDIEFRQDAALVFKRLFIKPCICSSEIQL